MASTRPARIFGLLCGLLWLSACADSLSIPKITFFENRFGAGARGAETTAATTSPRVVNIVSREVEAPDVFQASEPGLWDGRPSLGGIWVAHPEANRPERVVIRNAQTGKAINGALFKREREMPGPRFQVSSDAAKELGMLAGAPAEIEVVALASTDLPIADTPTVTAETTATGTETLPAPAQIATTSLDDPAPDAAAEAAAASAAAATGTTITAPPPAAEVEEAPRRGLFRGNRKKGEPPRWLSLL
jgi:hypothetical protein